MMTHIQANACMVQHVYRSSLCIIWLFAPPGSLCAAMATHLTTPPAAAKSAQDTAMTDEGTPNSLRLALVRIGNADVKFQIGSDKDGYIYTKSSLVINSKDVWQCQRGMATATGAGSATTVLWLFCSEAGHWVMVEADRGTIDPVAVTTGIPVFKTVSTTICDISESCPGLEWQLWDEITESWMGLLEFDTKRV